MDKRSEEKLSWLTLYLIKGLGNSMIIRLVKKFGSPENVLEAGLPELMRVDGIREDVARRITRRECITEPEGELEKAHRLNARIISFGDESYPPLLREIHSPPIILYLKGADLPPDMDFIAIVGSRNPTHYGIKVAERIGRGLALKKVGVVSGMAVGIDASAHQGSLSGKGFTMAVLGAGLDIDYPVPNRQLRKKIEALGLVVSEFPVGTPPEPRNFPIRNRIISGLSRGVVVVEATLKSGSLITASLALDQGREVFSVPGSINSFKSTGTHLLIKQGAKLVETADDILEEFRFKKDALRHETGMSETAESVHGMDDFEKKIFDILSDYPLHLDDIARSSGMDSGVVSSILMKLELKGVIKQLPGKIFVR